MDIKEYQELSKRTMPKIGSVISLAGDLLTLSKPVVAANYAMGITGESGETSDYLKKVIFHGHPYNKATLVKELGDVMHYTVGIATLFGISMEEVLEENIEKLKQRFPNGFNQSDSIKRVDVTNENKLIGGI